MEKTQGYRGERIDIQKILEEIQTLALAHGWRRDFSEPQISHAPRDAGLIAYHRAGKSPRKRIYLSAGIHGDEPAGPLAILQLLQENRWPDAVEIFLCPCLNPTGFPLNRRENANGIDLNRDYRDPQTKEIRRHIKWLQRQPRFDVTLCLHEDWEANGFYLYEQNPDGLASFAEKIIESVSAVCPIDRAENIDNWIARDGVIHPRIKPSERPQWPEALYLISHKTRLAYTLEAPSSFPPETRVASLVKAVHTVLDSMARAAQNAE